jgi:cobalamin biosynthesis Mg chelatase CobN
MRGRTKLCVQALGMAILLGSLSATGPAQAQKKQHVVSLEELNKDAARPAATRQADEASVRELLSSEAGQKALKSANLDYQKVDKAVGRLNDEDLAKIAERSRQAQSDFAARGLTSRLLVAIILIVVLVVALTLVF